VRGRPNFRLAGRPDIAGWRNKDNTLIEVLGQERKYHVLIVRRDGMWEAYLCGMKRLKPDPRYSLGNRMAVEANAARQLAEWTEPIDPHPAPF
jgi:hypothetical protein